MKNKITFTPALENCLSPGKFDFARKITGSCVHCKSRIWCFLVKSLTVLKLLSLAIADTNHKLEGWGNSSLGKQFHIFSTKLEYSKLLRGCFLFPFYRDLEYLSLSCFTSKWYWKSNLTKTDVFNSLTHVTHNMAYQKNKITTIQHIKLTLLNFLMLLFDYL